MTIYLIRHGKTEANEKWLYCGSTDLPLSEKGREELATIHYDIRDVRFLTSGMKRTDETLRLLFGDVPYETDPRFREVDFGMFEMQSYYEIKDTPEFQAWLTGDNEANVPPGGESGLQMKHLFPEENKSRYDWQPKNGKGYCLKDGSYVSL